MSSSLREANGFELKSGGARSQTTKGLRMEEEGHNHDMRALSTCYGTPEDSWWAGLSWLMCAEAAAGVLFHKKILIDR